VETKDEVSHSEHKFSEGAQHTDGEGPRSKAQGPPGGGNGVLAQKSLFYNMPTIAVTKPEFVVTNYCKLSFKVTSKEFQSILFK